jgi:large subunit ribosomal protein L29
MKASELRDMTDEELADRLADARQELLNVRFQLATGAIENTSRAAVVRRDIARILTVQRDRERSRA